LSTRSLQFKINLNNPSANYGWLNTSLRNFCDKKNVRNPQDPVCWNVHNIDTRTKIDAWRLYFARTISAILWHIALKITYFGSCWIPGRSRWIFRF
jgi:hypothetical protein